jgi:hypothetical protein
MPEITTEIQLKNLAISDLPDDLKLEFLEMLELNARGRADIVVFAEEMLGVPLNEFQKDFLRHTTTPRTEWAEKFNTVIDEIGGMLFGRNIAHPSNQIGKTVMISIKHIYFAYYKIGLELDEELIDKTYYSTLNISPHTRQVRACYNYVKDILNGNFLIDEEGKKRLNKMCPLLQNFLVGENTTLGELRFANKSIMYSVPVGQDQASSLAGGQFAYISYDECAQSHHLEAELGAKILSRLIKYGVCLDLISTPEVDAPSHQYYLHVVKLGEAGKEGWWSKGGKLADNRFISNEQQERIMADLLATNKQKYRQVVFGEFITGGKRFFEPAEIENLWKLSSKISCLNNHNYLLVSDWGMSDTGDESVFMVLDYTDWTKHGKIRLVNHEKIKGGSPNMQFALLRTLYESYTWYEPDGVTAHQPKFVMDANALGGVVIKKLLESLKPIGFNIPKDIALTLLKGEVSARRSYTESEIDGSIIEGNPDFGNIESYYIDELATQMGNYHLDDTKLTQDFVMCLMMGVSHIVKKIPKTIKATVINPLAGYNATVGNARPRRGQLVDEPAEITRKVLN